MTQQPMAPCYLYNLPNEILLHILAPFPTPELLPLTTVSHRIFALVLRVLHNRLTVAAALNDQSLLLECYQPAAKWTEPRLYCSYLGTDGLDTYNELDMTDQNFINRLGDMRNMYTRFRPHRKEIDAGAGPTRRHPAGDVPGSRTHPSSSQKLKRLDSDDVVRQTLSLEGHELFTQLCVNCLLKLAPGSKNRLYTFYVALEEGAVLRVWRDWLKKIADKTAGGPSAPPKEAVEDTGKGKAIARDNERSSLEFEDGRTVWVTPAQNTGFKFSVRERKLRRDAPILILADEDTPVSYEIEYDELLIRTSHLLLMLEKALLQEDNTSAKAVVFGSFR